MSLLQHAKGYQNGWDIKMASFVSFEKLDILVPVCFGTRLGASNHYPHSTQNWSWSCLVRPLFPLPNFSTVCRHVPTSCDTFHQGLFKGGVTEGGGFRTRVRGTMFVRVVVPWHPDCHASATSPSLLRDDQNLRDNRVTVQWRRAECRASPYRHPGCHANVVPPG